MIYLACLCATCYGVNTPLFNSAHSVSHVYIHLLSVVYRVLIIIINQCVMYHVFLFCFLSPRIKCTTCTISIKHLYVLAVNYVFSVYHVCVLVCWLSLNCMGHHVWKVIMAESIFTRYRVYLSNYLSIDRSSSIYLYIYIYIYIYRTLFLSFYLSIYLSCCLSFSFYEYILTFILTPYVNLQYQGNTKHIIFDRLICLVYLSILLSLILFYF